MLRSQLHSSDGVDADSTIAHFILLSSYLDSILHAEHKSVLEEMRADYFSTLSIRDEEDVATLGVERVRGVALAEAAEDIGVEGKVNAPDDTMEFKENQLPFLNGLDFFQLWGSSGDDFLSGVEQQSRASGVVAATRFQRSFMKLLQDAEFEELSVRDLMLTSALNTDYLLNLPIYVDWKKASESNTIIFRRGYNTEKQRGQLIVEKLDYLQSKILQAIFGLASEPLMKTGLWIKELIQNSIGTDGMQVWFRKLPMWVQDSFLFRQPFSSEAQTLDSVSELDHELHSDLPIWLAAQRAVSRYEGFLSSMGPRSRLLRKFLTKLGLAPSTSEVPFQFDFDDNVASEPHLRPVLLSRISLSDVWRPATRKYCGNDVWRMLKVGFSIIFSQSVLQEPAFQELILLYTEDNRDMEETGKADIPSLRLKIYEKIPMPDLAVIFPHKKLSFRILDTVRLDAATIIGLLAYIINYKFEDVLSSPSAVLLDVVAVTALIIYLIRVALGYKQTRDRYQLLVNRTLYEKTLASGFGTVHFLLDASEQQQYKECILAYGILLKAENDQPICREALRDECERFLYIKFKEKVQMPIDKTVDKLIEFGLVLEKTINGKNLLEVVPCSSAYDALRKRWDSLLS